MGTPTLILASAAAVGLLVPALWVLYHRLQGHKTLENSARKTIYDAIVDRPGLGVQELAAAANVSYSTASYHLDRLLKARMIVQSEQGGKLRYFKNGGALSEADRVLLTLLKNQEAVKVLHAILANPGTYRAALAQELGVSVTTLNWHLKRLLEAGLVSEAREGRSARLFADAEGLRARMASLAAKVQEGSLEAAALHRLTGAAMGTGTAAA